MESVGPYNLLNVRKSRLERGKNTRHPTDNGEMIYGEGFRRKRKKRSYYGGCGFCGGCASCLGKPKKRKRRRY